MFASFILYPFNLIRSKQQQLDKEFFDNIKKDSNKEGTEFYKDKTIHTNLKYGNFYKTTKLIHKFNGLLGFYKGLTPLLIRQVPGSTVFFYTYEYSLKYMNKNF